MKKQKYGTKVKEVDEGVGVRKPGAGADAGAWGVMMVLKLEARIVRTRIHHYQHQKF